MNTKEKIINVGFEFTSFLWTMRYIYELIALVIDNPTVVIRMVTTTNK